jgi:hypothetical protein
VGFTPVAGQVYLFRVGGFGGATGSVVLNLSVANDRCENAAVVSGSAVSASGSNVGASIDGPGACRAPAGDVWYRWTAPGDGVVTVQTCNTTFDTVLAVYQAGACPVTVAQEVACDDDGASCAVTASRVQFNATAGQVFLARVWGFGGAAGSFNLEFVQASCPALSTTVIGPSEGCDFESFGFFLSEQFGGGVQFQWLVNGAEAMGANNPSFGPPLAPGQYEVSCRITRPGCAAYMTPVLGVSVFDSILQAALSVAQPPCVGQPLQVSLDLFANFPGLVTFQWRVNGQVVPGITGPSVVVTPQSTAPVMVECRVTSNCAGTFSESLTLNPEMEPGFTSGPPATLSMCEGMVRSISVTPNTSGVQFQWSRNGQEINGGNGASLLIGPVLVEDSGAVYTCQIFGSCGSATSSSCVLTVTPGTRITQQPPPSFFPCIGTSSSISVAATGTGLTFQWRRGTTALSDGALPGGTVVSGTQTPTLVFTNPQEGDSGSYTCRVMGTCVPTTLTSTAVEVVMQERVLRVGPGQPFATIQSAVDALAPCGKVLVDPGTYNERVNFSGKRVHLESTGGAAVTTINGGNSADAVASTIMAVDGTENAAATVVKGFTITGGRGLLNGGLRFGGGMVVLMQGSPVATPRVEDCVFVGNTANVGGGVFAQGHRIRLVRVTFRDNVAAVTGGFGNGGGINAVGCILDAEGCVFEGNSTPNAGGAVHIQSTGPGSRFVNCLFVGNSAPESAGVNALAAPVELVNCTFGSHAATGGAQGWALTMGNFTAAQVRNTVVFPGSGAAGQPFLVNSGSITVERSLIPGTATGFQSVNNLVGSPVFVGGSDFRLAAGSPGIDAGSNALVPAGVTTDLAGGARFQDDPFAPNVGVGGVQAGIVDVGAFERAGAPADACAMAPTINAGTVMFSTVGATTDGPTFDSLCGQSVGADVWVRYVPECTGTVSISLCGSSFDTYVSVYRTAGCTATSSNAAACNDDSGVCGLQSRVTLNATAGEPLLIRVGGFNGASGNVTMEVSCEAAVVCTQDYNGIDGINGDDLADYIVDFFDSIANRGSGLPGGSVPIPGGFEGSSTGPFNGFGRVCPGAVDVPQPNPWGAPVGAYRTGGFKVGVGQNNAPCEVPNGDDLADYIAVFFNGCP